MRASSVSAATRARSRPIAATTTPVIRALAASRPGHAERPSKLRVSSATRAAPTLAAHGSSTTSSASRAPGAGGSRAKSWPSVRRSAATSSSDVPSARTRRPMRRPGSARCADTSACQKVTRHSVLENHLGRRLPWPDAASGHHEYATHSVRALRPPVSAASVTPAVTIDAMSAFRDTGDAYSLLESNDVCAGHNRFLGCDNPRRRRPMNTATVALACGACGAADTGCYADMACDRSSGACGLAGDTAGTRWDCRYGLRGFHLLWRSRNCIQERRQRRHCGYAGITSGLQCGT